MIMIAGIKMRFGVVVAIRFVAPLAFCTMVLRVMSSIILMSSIIIMSSIILIFDAIRGVEGG